MVSHAAPRLDPQPLTTVQSSDGTVVHLAPVEHAVPSLTLCRQPVVCRVSAQSFHRLGCAECALEAVRAGVTSIADRHQATVNLPRFLAARRQELPPAATR